MARLSYRSKVKLKKLFRALAVLFVGVLVIGFLALVYYQPQMVYTREGATLQNGEQLAAETPVQPTKPRPVVDNPVIVYDNKAVAEPNLSELESFYISADMLREPDKVLAAVKQLQGPHAVMVQLKSDGGYFYYNTSTRGATVATDIDTQKIAELISYLSRGDFYLIARVSAFVDNGFALANTSCGFPMAGGILWVDSNYRYWLNPTDPAVQNYLLNIGNELVAMGFDEVAFSCFQVPESDNIHYGTEKTPKEILADALPVIRNAFAESGIPISFVTTDKEFPVSLCTGRVYVPDVSGPEAEQFSRAFEAAGTLKEVAFIVNSKDSRFDGKAVLRNLPIESN